MTLLKTSSILIINHSILLSFKVKTRPTPFFKNNNSDRNIFWYLNSSLWEYHFSISEFNFVKAEELVFGVYDKTWLIDVSWISSAAELHFAKSQQTNSSYQYNITGMSRHIPSFTISEVRDIVKKINSVLKFCVLHSNWQMLCRMTKFQNVQTAGIIAWPRLLNFFQPYG